MRKSKEGKAGENRWRVVRLSITGFGVSRSVATAAATVDPTAPLAPAINNRIGGDVRDSNAFI